MTPAEAVTKKNDHHKITTSSAYAHSVKICKQWDWDYDRRNAEVSHYMLRGWNVMAKHVSTLAEIVERQTDAACIGYMCELENDAASSLLLLMLTRARTPLMHRHVSHHLVHVTPAACTNHQTNKRTND